MKINVDEIESALKARYKEAFDENRWNKQKRVIEPLYSGEGSNALGVLPTGTGKSFIYQYFAENNDGDVFVIEPLTAIIEDQISKSPIYAIEVKKNFQKETNDKCIMYCSPENLLSESEAILNESNNIDLIVIDEVHILMDWGASFRQDYRYLPQFIKRVKERNPNVRLLMLTATLNQMQADYLELFLGLDPKTTTRVICKNDLPASKDGLICHYNGKKEGKEGILDLIKQTDKEAKRECVMCFFNTENEIAGFYNELKDTLYAEQPNLNGDFTVKSDNHFQYYPDLDYYVSIHSFYGAISFKKVNLEEMSKFEDCDRPNEGELKKIILTTKALSMGVDMDVINRIIHIGLPESLSEYRQEIGRVRNPDADTEYIIYSSDKDAGKTLRKLVSDKNVLIDPISVVSQRIKVWDFLCLWYWYRTQTEKDPIGLDALLKKSADDILEEFCELTGSLSSKTKDNLKSLFSERITKGTINKESDAAPSKLFLNTNKPLLNRFRNNESSGVDGVRLNFLDYMVYNALETVSLRQKQNIKDLNILVYETLIGSLHRPRRDSKHKSGSEDIILECIDESINKLNSDKANIDGVRLFVLNSDGQMSFPFAGYGNSTIIGIEGDTIANLLKVDRSRISPIKLVAAHYTLVGVERANQKFSVRSGNTAFTSAKWPYSSDWIKETIDLINKKADRDPGSHYVKYQIPVLFERYLQNMLIKIYERSSKYIKMRKIKKNNYYNYYVRNPETKMKLYEVSSRGAYGLERPEEESSNPEEREKAWKKDSKTNLIINKYWLVRSNSFK